MERDTIDILQEIEEKEEYIQIEIAKLENSIKNCDISIVQKSIKIKTALLTLLDFDLISQKNYNEYSNQVDVLAKKATDECVCIKKQKY